MYVLFISRGYPTKKYRMNGIFEFDQAKALASLGHKVVFTSIDMRSIRRWSKWGIERKYIDGAQIYGINIPLERVPKSILTMFSSIGLNLLYRKIVKEQGEPDIMHAHFTQSGYIASKLRKKTKVPLVITEHSSQINKPTMDVRLSSLPWNGAF